jgi:hypothetical protein
LLLLLFCVTAAGFPLDDDVVPPPADPEPLLSEPDPDEQLLMFALCRLDNIKFSAVSIRLLSLPLPLLFSLLLLVLLPLPRFFVIDDSFIGSLFGSATS